MQIDNAIKAIGKFFEAKWNKPIKIVEVARKGDGWLARFEVLEESEYMTQFARDEMIGVYQAEMDGGLEVIGYKRLGLKNRAQLDDISEVPPEEEV